MRDAPKRVQKGCVWLPCKLLAVRDITETAVGHKEDDKTMRETGWLLKATGGVQ